MKKIKKLTNGSQANIINSMIQDKKSQGINITNFCVGDPNTDPPRVLTGGLMATIRKNIHQYTAVPGVLELRQKICTDIEKVIITPGIKQALYMSLMATCDPGDEVIIIGPAWSTYEELCKILNLYYTIIIPQTTSDIISAITENTSAVILCNPNNPTGIVYNADTLQYIQDACLSTDTWLICDETYADFIYTDSDFTSMREWDNVICVSGFSKSYAITGWRLGYIIVSDLDKDLISELTKIQSQISGPANCLAQYAVLTNYDYLKPIDKMIYKERRDLIALNNPILTQYKPQAGFYFYVPIKENSLEFCKNALEQYNIAFTPGDEYGVKNTIRISFANVSLEEIQQVKPVLDRLFDFL